MRVEYTVYQVRMSDFQVETENFEAAGILASVLIRHGFTGSVTISTEKRIRWEEDEIAQAEVGNDR